MAEVNPAYNNFGGLVKEVLEFGFNDGPQVNKARIEGWVNEAQQQVAREVEAPEFQETWVLKLVANIYKYELPANLLRIQDIYSPELLQRLHLLDLQQFDAFGHGEVGTPNSTSGTPEYYTLYKNEVWLFPTPGTISKGETLEVRYIAKPPYMTEEKSVPILAPDYWHLMIEYAVGRAFEAEDDFEAAQQHITRFKADLDAYGTDVQFRNVDRPRVVDGTWGSIGTARPI
jgi:hypothetical protein